MTTVQQDFQNRVTEIEAYFAFIVAADNGETSLRREDGTPAYAMAARDDLLRTFRASGILLLYNLMESTVTNAVEAVFDELGTHGVGFDECSEAVRRVVLANLKQHNPKEILSELQRLGTDIVTKTFKKDKIVSGNVDARKIRDLLDEYGIRHPAIDGNDLLIVKTNRNDLAHGSKSFAEVGRNFTVQDVNLIKDRVIAYLSAMLQNVTAYIQQQQYRAVVVAQ
jgi:hypothetical protein